MMRCFGIQTKGRFKGAMAGHARIVVWLLFLLGVLALTESRVVTAASPAASQSAAVMSADDIIAILQREPDALAMVKEVAAERLGVDPQGISDQSIYDRLRQDADLRVEATGTLEKLGYVPISQQAQGESQLRPGAQPSNPHVPEGGARPSAKVSETSNSEPQLRQMPVPYQSVPSLQALYSQIVSTPEKLTRFGSDMFLLGTGNANELPMDIPVDSDYVLGPGDNLTINMWGSQSQRVNLNIDRQGQIALPEAGTITITDLTIAEAQKAIQKALCTQFRDEHVEISLGRVRTVRVYVVGDVQRPGAYDVSSLSTLVNALYAAGGPTSRGSLRMLRQYRGKKLVREIDLYDFLLHGVRSDVARLLPGDTILVPPVGSQVSVGGMVRRPAIYELKGERDLKEILDLAGGVLVSASLKQITVERVEAHQSRTMLSAQVPEGSKASIAQLPDFPIQDGDMVRVMPILPYNKQVVYLDGHVFKPGTYPWKDGMSINDLLHSYEDVMPEPAEHGEIIRLVPPDLHPETVPFGLSDVLVGNDRIELQPFDTVRIYSRYDFDAPRVSIQGEVLRPGEYPMAAGMTVAGLLRLAGGFRRSAYREQADLSTYVVQSGEKVLTGHRMVEIQKALDGDKAADVTLKPGDVVGIRQLTGWNDIGSSITINGEIKFAGVYGLAEGERLSSVLKRAGGFREDAFPQGAVLERIQVREMEERNRQEMIHRIETSIPHIASGGSNSAQDQQAMLETMRQQQREVLDALRSHPSTGRTVIRITSDIDRWENTPADIVVRAGDTLSVPKLPDFVVVSGQVYNPTGITFRPGKDAAWYLRQSGGVTRNGDKGQVFILRGDGSVVRDAKGTIFGRGILGTRMSPGDSIIVPEKVIGSSLIWRNLIGTAQVLSSVALTGAAVGAF